MFPFEVSLWYTTFERNRYISMSETLRKQINYSVVCINEFAKRKSITVSEAFHYLSKYKGIAFLEENYEIEHTLSLEDALDDLEVICKNNGGTLQ